MKPSSAFPWTERVAFAQSVVKEILHSLPAELRKQAEQIPLCLERIPSRALQKEGIEPDTLGLMVGGTYAEHAMASEELPAEIFLFLDNLWDEAAYDPDEYREQIRITFLHELGHYLGLEEDELTDRDLE